MAAGPNTNGSQFFVCVADVSTSFHMVGCSWEYNRTIIWCFD
eukprot:COSAG01_NODE_67768_length_266_cov_0.610778_1_plen_41_part_10